MPRAAYDAIAGWYDEAVRQNAFTHDLVLPPADALLGDVQGQAICDLACGQGLIARHLAGRGARVTGIDLSEPLLEIARGIEAEAPLGIDYRRGDAQALPETADASFDAVVCAMALMDIPDLAATVGAVRRILRAGGRFVFAITHPCFEPPHAWWATTDDGRLYRATSTYHEEGFWRSTNPHGVRGKVGAHHRTLGTYVNTLAEANLALERMIEPRASARLIERVPGYAIVPVVLAARCRAL